MTNDHETSEYGAVELPAPSPAAQQLFGPRLSLAKSYVAHLGTTGVQHGLIGPREIPRLWDRHVLNCAVVADLLEPGASVADVGSGAGLPGIALAIQRPDVKISLVEPLLRRVTWLYRVVDDLQLPNVTVHRGRAQEIAASMKVDVVTARAVAPLENLIAWAFPLLAPQGRLLALKGQSAAEELGRSAGLLRRESLIAELVILGEDLLAEPTRVIAVTRRPRGSGSTKGKPSRRARRSP